jgi:hypothetical protein
MCLFIFSFLNPLYLLLHQDEEMNAMDQLRENKQKRGDFEETMRGERKKEKKKKLQRIK